MVTFQVRPKRCFQGIFLLRWFNGAFQSCSSKNIEKPIENQHFSKGGSGAWQKNVPKKCDVAPKKHSKTNGKTWFFAYRCTQEKLHIEMDIFAKIFKFFNFGRMSSAAPSAPAGFRLRVFVVAFLSMFPWGLTGIATYKGPDAQTGPQRCVQFILCTPMR